MNDRPPRRDRREHDVPYRAWVLLAAGYLILFLGGLGTLVWLGRQQDTIKASQAEIRRETARLALAASVFCEALRQPDDIEESVVLRHLERGEPVLVSPGCRAIARRLLASRPEAVP